MAVNDEQTMEHQDGTTPEADGTQISKFKSAEDRDKAYLELEKQAHAQAQELAEVKRKMEDFSASTAVQQDQQQFTDVYKSQEELKKFWDRFAQKPQEVFGEWAAQTMDAVEKRIAVRDAARDAISDFKNKHPDLAPYEEIVSIYVQRQPTNLSPRERLERAAPEARKMIASIAQRGTNQTQDLDTSTFVEAPSTNREPSSRTVSKAAPQEDALSEYLREQNSMMAKKMVPPRVSK